MRYLISLLAVLFIAGCDVEQTEEGAMPEVEVQGGNMPEYNVDTPNVDVGTREETVTVPTVDVEPADAAEVEELEDR